MKKLLLTMLLLAAVLPAAAKIGDVNANGTVDVADLNLVVDHVLGISQTDAADVNSDGLVDVADVNILVDIILGSYVPEDVTYTVGGVSFKMIGVAGGTFTMGNDDDPDKYELPAHQVTLSAFSIGETEVTQKLWQAVMGENPSYFSGYNSLPVEYVSWDDCQEFITKLNAMTGKTFRLPTEAEWEYAARGGNKSRGYTYSGSDNINDVAWYKTNSNSRTHDVATKLPNELGLYDMTGNVFEWCQDWYGAYSGEEQTDPTGPDEGAYRVNRGGGWNSQVEYSHITYRPNLMPSRRFNSLGLRLAM